MIVPTSLMSTVSLFSWSNMEKASLTNFCISNSAGSSTFPPPSPLVVILLFRSCVILLFTDELHNVFLGYFGETIFDYHGLLILLKRKTEF